MGSEADIPGRLGALTDADECSLHLGVSVHNAPQVFRGDAVPREVGVGDGDDKMVVFNESLCVYAKLVN